MVTAVEPDDDETVVVVEAVEAVLDVVPLDVVPVDVMLEDAVLPVLEPDASTCVPVTRAPAPRTAAAPAMARDLLMLLATAASRVRRGPVARVDPTMPGCAGSAVIPACTADETR